MANTGAVGGIGMSDAKLAKRQQTPSVPPLLRPWQAWLADLVPETADFLARSGLLLRPLIQAACPNSALQRTQAIGVGGLSRRGDFSRLSMSDWLLADAAPDEFLRRAAMHELLFLAPEPEPAPNRPEIVLLFDTGPLQLGAPRLAHLALWIVLARRAELLNATLYWGSAQALIDACVETSQNGAKEALSTRTDAYALDELAATRSPNVLDASRVATLAPLLNKHAGAEFWWLGAASSNDEDCIEALALLPVALKARFQRLAISESLGAQRHLQVQFGAKTVVLPLPKALAAAEILRHPAKLRPAENEANTAPVEALALTQLHCGPFSLQQPLVFSTDNTALLLAGLNEPALLLGIGNRGVTRGVTSNLLRIPEFSGKPVAIDLIGRRLSVIEHGADGWVTLREFGLKTTLPTIKLAVGAFPSNALGIGLARWRTLLNGGEFAYLLSQEKLFALDLRAANVRLLAEQVQALERYSGRPYAVFGSASGQSELSMCELSGGKMLPGFALQGGINRPFLLASGEWLYQHVEGHWTIGRPNSWRVLPWRSNQGAIALGVALHGSKNPQLCVLQGERFRFFPLNAQDDQVDAAKALPDLACEGVKHAALSPSGARLAWLRQDRELHVYSLSNRALILRCAGQSQLQEDGQALNEWGDDD